MRHFSRDRFADSFVSVRLTFTSAHGGCRPPTAENNAPEIPSVPPRLTSPRHASLRLTLVDGCRGRTSDLNAVEYAAPFSESARTIQMQMRRSVFGRKVKHAGKGY